MNCSNQALIGPENLHVVVRATQPQSPTPKPSSGDMGPTTGAGNCICRCREARKRGPQSRVGSALGRHQHLRVRSASEEALAR